MAESRANGIDAMAASLVRLNAHMFGGVLALLAGPGLFLATLALIWRGGPMTGQMLGLLAHFLPGYAISPMGALIGGCWAALLAYIAGWGVGRAFGPWLLTGAVRMLERRAGGELGSIHTITSLRPLAFAAVSGTLLSLGLVLATSWLWWRYGGHASPHLDLLANFLPGYQSNPFGALVGAVSLFGYGFAAAFAIAAIYGWVARARRTG